MVCGLCQISTQSVKIVTMFSQAGVLWMKTVKHDENGASLVQKSTKMPWISQKKCQDCKLIRASYGSAGDTTNAHKWCASCAENHSDCTKNAKNAVDSNRLTA